MSEPVAKTAAVIIRLKEGSQDHEMEKLANDLIELAINEGHEIEKIFFAQNVINAI